MTNSNDITIPWDDPSWFDEDEIEKSENTTDISSQNIDKTNNNKEKHLSVIDEYSETSESISNQIDEHLMSIKNNCPTSAKFIAAQNRANEYLNQRNFYNRQYQADYNYQPNRNNRSPNNYKSRNNGQYNSNRNYKQNDSNNEYYENRDSFVEKPNNYNNKKNPGYRSNTTSFKRQMERDSYRNYQSNDEERYPKHNSMNPNSNNVGANSATTEIQKGAEGENKESDFGDHNQQINALNVNIIGTKNDSFDESCYKRSSEKKATTEANSTLTTEIEQVKIGQTKLEENDDIKPETPKRQPIEIYNVNSVKGKWSSLFNENKDKSVQEHQSPLNVPEADQQASNSNLTKEDHNGRQFNELENLKYNKNDMSNLDYQNSPQYNRKLRNTGQINDQDLKNKNLTRVNYEQEPQYDNGKTMASQPANVINKVVEYNSTGKNYFNNSEFSDDSRFQSSYNDTGNDPRRYINDRNNSSVYDSKGTRKPNFNRNGYDNQNSSFKNESTSLRGDRYSNVVNDDLRNPNSVESNTRDDSNRFPYQQVCLKNDISGYERKNVNMKIDQNDKVDLNEDRKVNTKGNNYKRNPNWKSKRTNNDSVKYEGENDNLATYDQRQDSETTVERHDYRVAERTNSPNNKGNNYKRNQNWKNKRTSNDSVKFESEKYDLTTKNLQQNSEILDESNDAKISSNEKINSPNYRNSYRRNQNWKNKRTNNNYVKSETEKEELETSDLRPNSETVEESGDFRIASNERIDSPNNHMKRYPNDRNNFNNTESRRKQTWINSRNQKNEKWGVTKDDRLEIENDLKGTQNEINEQGSFQSRRNQNSEEKRANDKFDLINGEPRRYLADKDNMFNDDYRRFMAEKNDTNYNWRERPPKELSGKDVNESFQATGGNFVNIDSRKQNRNKSKSVESDYLRFKTGREGPDVKQLSDQSNDRLSDNKIYRHGINNEEFTKIEGECIYYTQNSKDRRFGNENNSNFDRSNSFNRERGTKSKFLTEDEILANQGFIRPENSYRDRNSQNVSQRNNRNFPNSPTKFSGPNNHEEAGTAPYQDKPKSYQNTHFNRSSQNQRSFDGDYRSKNIKNNGNI